MRKVTKECRAYIKSISIRKRKRDIKNAAINKHRLRFSKKQENKSDPYRELMVQRNKIVRMIHKEFDYSGGELELSFNGDIGIEDPDIVDSFFDNISKTIDFNSKELTLDLSGCTRVWPSAITLFCSLYQWVKIAADYNHKSKPKIFTVMPDCTYVESYLQHSGFLDYVRTNDVEENVRYNDEEIVKIKHEKNHKNVESREIEICELLRKYTCYDCDEIELFDSTILTEVFNNVSEHGISGDDKGWWVLAQYHPTHKLISLNIADNGVGLRHTLMTGPQKNDIQKKIDNIKENEGKLINYAMTESISGAFNASTKEGFLIKNYERGSRRGNGLQRIIDSCGKLKIEFSILSHYGYAFRDSSGELKSSGYRDNRIFAGTLYNFKIPAEVE